MRMHDFGGFERSQILTFLDQASQVAVGEDAQHTPVCIGDGRCTQTFVTHLAHEFAEPGLRQNARHLIA